MNDRWPRSLGESYRYELLNDLAEPSKVRAQNARRVLLTDALHWLLQMEPHTSLRNQLIRRNP